MGPSLTLYVEQAYKVRLYTNGALLQSEHYTEVTAVQTSIPSWTFLGLLSFCLDLNSRKKKVASYWSQSINSDIFSILYHKALLLKMLASPSSISQAVVLLNWRQRGMTRTTIWRSFCLVFKDKVSSHQAGLELLICLPPPLRCWESFLWGRTSQVWWYMPEIPSTRRLEGSV